MLTCGSCRPRIRTTSNLRWLHATSQCVRKRIEEIFGWMKTVGGFRRTRLTRTNAEVYADAACHRALPLDGVVAERASGAFRPQTPVVHQPARRSLGSAGTLG